MLILFCILRTRKATKLRLWLTRTPRGLCWSLRERAVETTCTVRTSAPSWPRWRVPWSGASTSSWISSTRPLPTTTSFGPGKRRRCPPASASLASMASLSGKSLITSTVQYHFFYYVSSALWRIRIYQQFLLSIIVGAGLKQVKIPFLTYRYRTELHENEIRF